LLSVARKFDDYVGYSTCPDRERPEFGAWSQDGTPSLLKGFSMQRIALAALTLGILCIATCQVADAGVFDEIKRFKNRGYRPSQGYRQAVRDVTNRQKISNEYNRFRNRGYIPSRGYAPIVQQGAQIYGGRNGVNVPSYNAPRHHFTPQNRAGMRYYAPRMVNPYFYGY